MTLKAADRLIVALDYTQLKPALAMAKKLAGLVRFVKVGSALFTACGPLSVEQLRRVGLEVMLDLKFFDIPATVGLSCEAAAALGVSLLTVHASGEPEMLKAAVAGARCGTQKAVRKPPIVLGVTVLTSTGGQSKAAVSQQVVARAAKAARTGLGGVVVSAQEARLLKRKFGKTLFVVCPGIRPADSDSGDQKRIATPTFALKAGADFLVVGRPITEAANPHAAAKRILQEMEEVLHAQ